MNHTTNLPQRIKIMRKERSELLLEKGNFLHDCDRQVTKIGRVFRKVPKMFPISLIIYS